MNRSAALVRADALRIPLRDESVDLIVTSPPYFALRSYRDDGEHYDGQIGSEETPQAFLEALWAVTAECWRVLKPTGSLFVNLGDKYAGSGGHNNGGLTGATSKVSKKKQQAVNESRTQYLATRRSAPDRYNQNSGGVPTKSLMGLPWRYALGCIDRGWLLRAEIIWSKPNGLPESVTDRVRRSHETWFHLTKQGSYFASTDEIREAHIVGCPIDREPERSEQGNRPYRRGTVAAANGSNLGLNPLGKLPPSVWTIPTEPLIVPDYIETDHFAAFPQEWPRRLILGWSPPDGVVLDPFAGTGTVPMVARSLGRYGVGIDLSADYLKLARWRVFESGHASKTIRRTNEERQGSLIA